MTSPRKRLIPRWISIPFFILVGLATLVLLLVAVENWRAERAWRALQEEFAAAGESVDWRNLAPPEVPADQNFAMTPALKPLLDYEWASPGSTSTTTIVWRDPEAQSRAAISLPPRPRDREARRKREGSDGRADLEGWWEAFKESPEYDLPDPTRGVPQDILAALEKHGALMGEAEAASRRPFSRFAVHYDESFQALLPYLSVLKGWSAAFQLRSAARLAAGDVAGAFADVQTILRLADTLAEDPLLISHLVRVAMLSIATHAFWEGWAGHQWNADQLAWFQAEFARRQVRAELPNTLRGERALSISGLDRFLQHPEEAAGILNLSGADPGTSASVGRFLPRAIIRRNQIAIARYQQQQIDRVVDAVQRGVRLSGPAADDEAAFLAMSNHPYNLLARLLLPAISKVMAKTDRAQVVLDLAVVATALERYRLAQGEYPAALAALVPDYLAAMPVDLMSGDPLIYERRTDGWFDLRSRGLDGDDDAGGFEDGGETGDWPWPLPLVQTGMRLF